MARKIYVWKDARKLTKAAQAVLWGNCAIGLLGLASTLALGWVRPYSGAEAEFSGLRLALGALEVLMAIGWVSMGVVLVWMYRASANAHSLRPNMSHSVQAMFYWYVVPIWGFVMPLHVLQEVWGVAAGADRPRDAEPWLLQIWWGLFLGFGLLTVVAEVSTGSDELFGIAAICWSLGAGASAAFALVVKRISAMMSETHQASAFAGTPVLSETPAG